MNRASLQRRIALAVCLLALLGCTEPPERTTAVGRSFLPFEDPGRGAWGIPAPRPVATTIWYPAAAGSREVEWRIATFRAGWTAPDAEWVETPRRLPLVVLSHGTGGAALQLSWLAEHLASTGFLVAAVNHHGNTAAEDAYAPQGFALWWERARDVSFLLDRLQADPRFGHRIDPSRVGVAGFSLGGYTALAVAGARIDQGRWKRYCDGAPHDPSCRLPPEAPFDLAQVEEALAADPAARAALARAGDSYRDERVRAAFALAPVLGPALDRGSLEEIRIPVRLVVGGEDDQAEAAANAIPIADAIPGAGLRILPGVGHYTFLAPCTLRGRLLVRPLCTDLPGTDRRRIHRLVAEDALAFFDDALGNAWGRSSDR